MIRDPKATKNLILSLLMLNPGYEFTTEDIFRIALHGDGYNSLYHKEIQTNIRCNIKALRNEGYPIDAVDSDGRRRYFYNPKNIQHHLMFEPGMDNELHRSKNKKL